MKTRIFSFLIALCLVFPLVFSLFVFESVSPFGAFDSLWEESLSSAVFGGETLGENLPSLESQEGRYVLKFKDNVTLFEIESLLDGMEYSLLAESESRLFAVSSGEDFLRKNGDKIEYYERDLVRNVSAVTNDPISMGSYESLGVYKAWDVTTGSKDVIVAVLDTGVAREHEDLQKANILPGYDAVEQKVNVTEDSAGHGTGVIGIIAATANNGLGIAGVANGVSILPVKVSTTGTTIYSSDLIRGIRFAADAGAKVINMSIGGYSASFAEQEAVDYAISKGCIMIAAAGNGGLSAYADQKSYPASYEGVISVASCNNLGLKSSFSQSNDSVDVAAYGENITMPVFLNQESTYKTDSGTSFSCAIVSGIAALAASNVEKGIRFNNDEFLALITDTCNAQRNDALGHGIINAEKILMASKMPIITGVVNGGSYAKDVKIGFNRGIATLDGEPISDKENVISSGTHKLTVTDGQNTKNVVFRLNYNPLSYEYFEFASYSYFKFQRGTATLDGFPYTSGQRITASGVHKFVLVYGEEKVEKEVNLRYCLPAVFGVEDGKTYNSPVQIRVIGDGKAELDGEEFFGEVTVAEGGNHVLAITSGNEGYSQDIEFEIKFPQMEIFQGDYEDGKAIVDEENGYICLYGDTLTGVRVYDISSPTDYTHLLHVGTVYSHGFSGDKLLLFGENGVTVLDRRKVAEGETAVEKVISPAGIDGYVFGDGTVYCFGDGDIFTLDINSGVTTLFYDLNLPCENALYSQGKLCILPSSEGDRVHVFDCRNFTLVSFRCGVSLEHLPLFFNGKNFAAGGFVFDIRNGEKILEIQDFQINLIKDGMVFADNSIIDLETGRVKGVFPFDLSDIYMSEGKTYLFGSDGTNAVVTRKGVDMKDFGAAIPLEKTLGDFEDANQFLRLSHYDKYYPVSYSAVSEKYVYMILSGKNSLVSFDPETLEEQPSVPLRFNPKSVFFGEGYVVVTFQNASSVFVASEGKLAEGKYIHLPGASNCATVFKGKLLVSAGGMLMSCNPDGSDITGTGIQCEYIALDGENVFVFGNGMFSCYDETFKLLRSMPINGGNIVVGDDIAVGSTIYNPTTFVRQMSLSSEVLAFNGNTFVTRLGVMDYKNREFISNLGFTSIDSAVITKSNSVIAFSNGYISINRFGDDSEVSQKPNVSGIADGGSYQESATAKFDRGVAYLDGTLYTSGTKITTPGAHALLLVLPCGRNTLISFKIIEPLSGIEFLVGDRTLSVGETVTFRMKYLPEGASSIPVTFVCDSDGLEISENGVMTALKAGTYTVRAKAEQEGKKFETSCVIHVLKDELILFPDDSGFDIDRDNGVVSGIKGGTSVRTLLGVLTGGRNSIVTNKNGVEKGKKDIVSTGDKIVLYAPDGEIYDQLTLAVFGDTDGDGYVSAYDMFVLERFLQTGIAEAEFFAAADVNHDGVLSDGDFRSLKNILLGKTQDEKGTPPDNPFGNISVQTLSKISKGDIIEIPIYISGCKYARGVYGTLNFSGLELLEAESMGWILESRTRENTVGFYVHAENGIVCGSSFKVLANLRFRVTAENGEKISVYANSLSVTFEDSVRNVRFVNFETLVSPLEHGKFNIKFNNGDGFEFDKNKNDYTVQIPYNNALADINVVRGEKQTSSVSSLVIPDSGEKIVTVSLIDENGDTEFYNITVKRGAAPVVDMNCKLETLEVEGHRLSPSFDEDFYDYSISVPHGTEKINIYCVAQSSTANVLIGDTSLSEGTNQIPITISSPDGESLVYTVNVTVLPPVVVPSEPSQEESVDHGGTEDVSKKIAVMLTILLIPVLAGGGILLYGRWQEKKEN